MNRIRSLIVVGFAVVVGFAHGCAAVVSQPPAKAPRATPVFTDFSFVSGAPVSGARLTACGRMVVVTTNTERLGGGSFRNNLSGKDANVTLTFDRPIRAFDLAVSSVRSDEYLSGFNVENPQKLSGTLTQTAGGHVTTSHPYPADDGAGALSWLNLQTEEIQFAVGGPPGSAIAVDGFFVTCGR